MTLTALVVLATTPPPSPSPSTVPFGPTDTGVPGSGDSVSAGLYALLIIVVLGIVLGLLLWSMNGSLKRARRNLGGDVLPRRASDQLPVSPKGSYPPEGTDVPEQDQPES